MLGYNLSYKRHIGTCTFMINGEILQIIGLTTNKNMKLNLHRVETAPFLRGFPLTHDKIGCRKLSKQVDSKVISNH